MESITDITDYASAYRQYCAYGKGRSLSKFCEDENFNYTKLRRYAQKSFWDTKTRPDNASPFVGLEVETDSLPTTSVSIHDEASPVDDSLSVVYFSIRFSDGLTISTRSTTVASIVSLLHKVAS